VTKLSQIKICKASTAQIPLLQAFFCKAYGEDTIFQNRKFLTWYFGQNKSLADSDAIEHQPLSSWIALNSKGEIVAHYGALISELARGNHLCSIYWGVSAFTLPEYRGSGIGRDIFLALFEEAPILGVIGFSQKTAQFYQDSGFNLFNRMRFKRHVLILSDHFQKISQFIGAEQKLVSILLNNFHKSEHQLCEQKKLTPSSIVRLTSYHLSNSYELSILDDSYLRTRKTKEYLQRRFLSCPFINYEVIAFVQNNKIITSYITLRREHLRPTEFFASRIVDIAGHNSEIADLVWFVLTQCKARNDLYIDFGIFGTRYDKLLNEMGFICLHNEEVEALPQVSDPIQRRPNNEYIGIKEIKEIKGSYNQITDLTENQVLFTRADSDRDRIARLPAITIKETSNE
jgi:GNAT superfamily N-acetyltransferase